MVPARAVLGHIEDVGKGRVGRNWTLCDCVDAVHLSGLPLSETMPVNSSAIFTQGVQDGDLYLITPAGLDARSWQSSIEQLYRYFGITVGTDDVVSEIDEVIPNYAARPIHFIIDADIVLLTSFGIVQPAVSVSIVVTSYPAVAFWIVRILTLEWNGFQVIWWDDNWVRCRLRDERHR